MREGRRRSVLSALVLVCIVLACNFYFYLIQIIFCYLHFIFYPNNKNKKIELMIFKPKRNEFFYLKKKKTFKSLCHFNSIQTQPNKEKLAIKLTKYTINETQVAFVSVVKETRKMFYILEGVWVRMKIRSN